MNELRDRITAQREAARHMRMREDFQALGRVNQVFLWLAEPLSQMTPEKYNLVVAKLRGGDEDERAFAEMLERVAYLLGEEG